MLLRVILPGKEFLLEDKSPKAATERAFAELPTLTAPAGLRISVDDGQCIWRFMMYRDEEGPFARLLDAKAAGDLDATEEDKV